MKEKEIYFHVGLGKAASTFLQYQFFGKLKGIKYLQRSKYKNYKKHIENCTENKILISREMDNQIFEEVEKFLIDFPQTKIIIFFRQHSSWLLSQYKRQVKNGFANSFKNFIDVKNNKGSWKTEQANFTKIINFLDQKCKHQTLIINYKYLKSEPKILFDKIANYTKTTYNFEQINLNAKHKSYSSKQLILKRKLNKFLFNKNWEFTNAKILNWLLRRTEMLLTYIIFTIANVLPKTFFKDEMLFDKNYLSEIDNFYFEDWKFVEEHF